MKKQNRFFQVFFWAFLLSVSIISTAAADMDNTEIIVSHPVALYPDAVPESDLSSTPDFYFTKKSIEEVKAFFDSGKQATDRFEPYSGHEAKGTVLYMEKLGKRFDLVTITEKTGQEFYAGQALGQLQALATRGMHSESELREAENKYSKLKSSYFRKINDDNGHSKSESEIIYKKYLQIAHPDLEKSKGQMEQSEDYKAGKAQAAEIKKQMKEMKAKGDIAGMMNLATSGKGPGVPKDAQKYMDAMNKDTWDTWIKCLDEMNTASFPTAIKYKSGIFK